jgi:phosphoglycerol transferase MdoB-like AlkP superfamily enzyme
MDKILDKIKQLLKSIKEINYKGYLSTNILFFTTVISSVINALILRAFTVGNALEIKPFLGDFAIVLIVCSFGYLIKPRKQIIYFLTLTIIFTSICVINSIYYTFYQSFASISLLATSLQVIGVGDAVVKNVLKYRDFIFLWQPIVLFIIHLKLKKKNYYKHVEVIEVGKKRFFGTLIAAGMVFFIFTTTLTQLEFGRLIKQWNREFLVAKFGIYIYQANDIIRSLEPQINTIFGYDKAIQSVRTYYEENAYVPSINEYTNIFEGKNIIMIHAESIQQFVIDLKFNDNEVTPVLNRLSKEGLAFSNFYSQVSVGTSSDTEFTLSTSLLPVSSGTVFIGYWDRSYVAIPQLLSDKGYYTFSMHGNNGTFWNRLVMYEKLGYDKFYHKAYYNIDEEIGLGLSDKSFFRQSIPMIKEISEEHSNFYATMIMLTNHTPFDETDKYGEFPVTMKVEKENELGELVEVETPYMEGTTLGNYFKSVHYADSAIGEFLDGLDAEGLLDNTVIVIYGDHDARLSKKDYTTFYNYDPYTETILNRYDPNYKEVDYYSYELNRKIPFIIWAKDVELAKEIDEVMGMYDVLPTLGNMFGFSSEYALGHDIFSVDENVVVFANGNWLTNKIYYNSQKQEYLPLTTEVISEAYIDKYVKKAEDYISVSNDLIIYDYIKNKTESEKLKEEILQ